MELVILTCHLSTAELDKYSHRDGAEDVKNPFLSNLLKCLVNLTTLISVMHDIVHMYDLFTALYSSPSWPLHVPLMIVLSLLSQEPIPTVEAFLPILLESWDGEDYQHEVLSLLSHLSLQPFEGKKKKKTLI